MGQEQDVRGSVDRAWSGLMERVSVYFSLGTNIGDRRANMLCALDALDRKLGCGYYALSDFIETEPWGFESEDRFLNAAVRYVLSVPRGTSRSRFAHGILDVCKGIERSMGRNGVPEYDDGGRRIYRSRIIDIDILMIDDWRIDESDLKIPHPLMQERDFVMIPLRQIWSGSELYRNGTFDFTVFHQE